MQDDQRQDSRLMAIIFKLLWLFLRSLERGGVSELGLAQCEDSFPTTKPKKDRDSRVDCLLETGVSISRQDERSGREKRGLSATRDFGTLYCEDRRPLYCATESHRTVSSGLFLGSQEARSEWSMPRVAPTLERRQLCNALFSLIVVLNRNTLAPSTIRSTERGR